MKFKTILAALAFVLTPMIASTASAAGFNYTYVEGGYYDLEEENGLGARGSYSINKDFYLAAELAFLDNIDVVKFGAGYHTPINKTVDAFGQFMYVDLDNKNDGFNLRGGVRAQLNRQFELGGGLSYYDLTESDMGFFIRGVVNVAPKIDVSVELEAIDNQDALFIAGRFNF